MRSLLILFLLLPLPLIAKASIAKQAKDYFETYAERKDFNKLLSFYTEDAVLDDLVYGHLASGKAEIKAFFNWPNGNFKVLNHKAALTITRQSINGRFVTTRGTFNRFEYMGKTMGPWRFIIWQEFNELGQIQYQEDWINYTPKKDFASGQNRNPSQ